MCKGSVSPRSCRLIINEVNLYICLIPIHFFSLLPCGQNPNMSDFLFYQPNSNPANFSKRKRFSR